MAAHPRPAAWSFQQAGEKSLKAVLLQLWRVFRTIYLIRAILAKTVRRVCRKEAQKAQESDGMRRRTAEGWPQRGAKGARIGWDAAADGGGGQRAEAEVDFCGHMPTKINA